MPALSESDSFLWQGSIRSIAISQFLVAMLGFSALAVAWDFATGLAFLYGALLMLANGLWLARKVRRAADAGDMAGRRVLYQSAAVRFLSLIVMLMVAYGLALSLPVVAAGMFVAQLMLFIVGGFHAVRGDARTEGD